MSGCALYGAPRAIPADKVIAPPPAPPRDDIAMSQEFDSAGIGADHLRGRLSGE